MFSEAPNTFSDWWRIFQIVYCAKLSVISPVRSSVNSTLFTNPSRAWRLHRRSSRTTKRPHVYSCSCFCLWFQLDVFGLLPDATYRSFCSVGSLIFEVPRGYCIIYEVRRRMTIWIWTVLQKKKHKNQRTKSNTYYYRKREFIKWNLLSFEGLYTKSVIYRIVS